MRGGRGLGWGHWGYEKAVPARVFAERRTATSQARTSSGDMKSGWYSRPTAATNSSVGAWAAGRLDAAAGDARHDLPAAQPSEPVVEVVALVRVQLGRAMAPGSIAGADRPDTAHQRDQRLAVVKVGAGNAHRDRQPVAVTDNVDLRPELAAISRIRSGQGPPLTARTLTESIAQRDQSSSPFAPSRSRTTRCSLAHTRAVDQSVKRR